MTQLSQFATGTADSNLRRVMVIHQQGDQWRALQLSRDDKDGPLRVDDYRSFAIEESDPFIAYITESGVDGVVRILAGGTVICRKISVPRMDDDTLSEVLDLQAEAVLPAGTESHRRAVALLPWTNRQDDEYEAVALAWPGREPDDDIDLLLGDLDLHYAPVASCLLEALAESETDHTFAGYFDRETGTLDLIVHHRGVSTFRTLRMDTAHSGWVEQLEHDLTETAMSIGIEISAIDSWREQLHGETQGHAQAFIMDESLRGRIVHTWEGVFDLREDELWRQFGLLLMAGVGRMGSRSHLFSIPAFPPEEKRNPIVDWLHWLDHPARAAFVLIAAILLISFVPLGAAWGRYRTLHARIGDDEKVAEQAQRSREEAQFYELLNKKRWPMTKLLADITGSAPYPVRIQEITIDSESGQVRLKGTAPTNDDLTVFREVLGTAGIFEQIRVPRSETKAHFVEFEIIFGITDATRPVERAFTDSYARILYGDQADEVQAGEYELNTPTIRNALGGSRRTGGSSAAMRRGLTQRSGRGGGTASNVTTGSPEGAASILSSESTEGDGEVKYPEAITPEQIGKLNYQQTMAAVKERTGVMYGSPIDDATRQRLLGELKLLNQRAGALNSGKKK